MLSYDEVTGKGAARISFDQVEVERATEYAAGGRRLHAALHRVLSAQIEARREARASSTATIEMPVMPVLWRMERNGVLLDGACSKRRATSSASEMLEIEQQAHEQAGQPFNLGSPKQIQEILFERTSCRS